MFFGSWHDLGRVLAVGVLAYVALVALLRISGNRTLSKLNAFDLVVTVALGSTLASVLTSKDVSLATGVCALALLVLLQYIVTWTSFRWASFDRLVKSEPIVVVLHGRFIEGGMRRARVSEDEVRATLRKHGVAELGGAHAVVLETDGTLSVLEHGGPPRSAASTLQGTRAPGLEPRTLANPGEADA